jgi:transposase InsO family protein
MAMPRRSDEERKAAALQKIAAQKMLIKRIEHREAGKARRDRAHVGIVVGWALIEHAARHPNSEVTRVLIHALKGHLAEHENDRPVADLLERLTAPADQHEAAE